ncbi:MAG: glycosyltransferase family 2 protein [Erythrobacter sp.]|nr:glycosyltransferase family 2 protein [Erythrobacter sp.]
MHLKAEQNRAQTSQNAPPDRDVGYGASNACIIVPTYNRPRELARCLERLAQLEGGPWPVVVIDDGGAEPVADICAKFGHVTLVRQENTGPAGARNRGAREAEGYDLLLFIDDDCEPEPDWARELAAAQGGVEGRMVGGRVINALPGNPYSAASQALCSFLYDFYHATDSDMAFFTTNNICCRRQDFLDLGGFDTGFARAAAEDRDFGIRWRDAGGTLVYAPGAVVAHAHELALGSFWRQHSNYGRGARTLHLAMDQRADERPKLEGARFYLGMLTSPFRHGGTHPVFETILVGLSQVAMVSGYVAAFRAERGGRSV